MPYIGGELRFNTLKRARVTNVLWLVDVDYLLNFIPYLILKLTLFNKPPLGGPNLEDNSLKSFKIIGVDTLDELSDTVENN